MSKRKIFIQHREFISEVAEITGLNPIDIEYAFGRAEILGEICVFEADLTNEQAAEIDRRAKERRQQANGS